MEENESSIEDLSPRHDLCTGHENRERRACAESAIGSLELEMMYVNKLQMEH